MTHEAMIALKRLEALRRFAHQLSETVLRLELSMKELSETNANGKGIARRYMGRLEKLDRAFVVAGGVATPGSKLLKFLTDDPSGALFDDPALTRPDQDDPYQP